MVQNCQTFVPVVEAARLHVRGALDAQARCWQGVLSTQLAVCTCCIPVAFSVVCEGQCGGCQLAGRPVIQFCHFFVLPIQLCRFFCYCCSAAFQEEFIVVLLSFIYGVVQTCSQYYIYCHCKMFIQSNIAILFLPIILGIRAGFARGGEYQWHLNKICCYPNTFSGFY